MKNIIGITAALLLSTITAQAATAEARHTHSVFYPGVNNQPVLQLKITGTPGEKIKCLKFTTAESTAPNKFKGAQLSASGNRNAYTLHTKNPAVQKGALSSVRNHFSFNTDIELGDTPLTCG